ncbi:lysophospholipid acyltransferase family protein [Polyangium sp. y55x31]|uniref:lysophospholipid acyltransferase family protein n=1 Tax=Polyangium sp. y55x31 TaxID=3042688 RepID=UPI0024830780|nr:lysophospholipid acyltransferase family protein [Polyangium sp. y55x31]MDI1475983.1 lysophospholipid acyltransferase family protein [Polyangium sp. y55x31]
MQLREAIRAARQWGPFTARTVGYGTISLTLGPLTKDHSASTWAMKRWCKSSARGLHIDVEATGLENVPTEGAYVYCSNHQSLLDILVLGAVLPGDYKWAAKRELMNIPFLGWHLKLAGHVPVERGGGPRVAAEVIKRFTEVLGHGKPLLVFPEGTRSEDGVLKEFKMGGFYAAVRAGVPVVPVALEGAGNLMQKGAIDTGDGSMRLVRVRVGKPIHPLDTGKEAARVVDLRDRTHAAVAEMLISLGGRVAEAPSKQDGSSTAASSAES